MLAINGTRSTINQWQLDVRTKREQWCYNWEVLTQACASTRWEELGSYHRTHTRFLTMGVTALLHGSETFPNRPQTYLALKGLLQLMANSIRTYILPVKTRDDAIPY